MAWSEGDVYRCPNPACGCEVTVTKAPQPGQGGDLAPTCCCGETMQQVGRAGSGEVFAGEPA